MSEPPNPINVQIEHACDALAEIQPWNYAKSENPYAVILEDVRKAFGDLVVTLKWSKEVADKGCKTCQVMISTSHSLLQRVKGGTPMGPTDISRYSEDVGQTEQLREQLAKVAYKFFELQGVLNKLKNEMNEDTRDIEDMQLEVIEMEKDIDQRRQRARVIRKYSMIALPFALPIIYVAGKAFDNKMQQHVDVIVTEKEKCEDALQMWGLSKDLEELDLVIDEFQSFWGALEVIINNLTGQDRIERLHVPLTQKIYLDDLKKKWTAVAYSFRIYLQKMEILGALVTSYSPESPLE